MSIRTIRWWLPDEGGTREKATADSYATTWKGCELAQCIAENLFNGDDSEYAYNDAWPLRIGIEDGGSVCVYSVRMRVQFDAQEVKQDA